MLIPMDDRFRRRCTADGVRHLAPLKEECEKEIVGELSRRNPALYPGKTYTTAAGREVDNFEEPGPVVEKYKRQAQ